MYEIDDAIESVQKAQNILGESPSVRQYDELGLKPSSSVITERWGWQEVKKRANLKVLNRSSRANRNSNDIEPKPDHVTIPEDENWEKLSPHMRWYYKNQEKAKDRVYLRRDELKEKIQQIKLDKGCKECGYDEHYAALDFHHKENREKTNSISNLIHKGHSSRKILKEIDKCFVLCANCHRVHHSED